MAPAIGPEMAPERLPPAQPTYVLRGHASQIHALCFYGTNARLLTADADGWVVSWSLAYKRPVAVWRAHGNAVLGLASWGGDRMVTHGRDNKLIIWKLTLTDEISLDKSLPVDDPLSKRAQPWILHMLDVNALNFCAFALCKDMREVIPEQRSAELVSRKEEGSKHGPILIAIPNTLDSEGIDVFHFPSESRISTIPPDKTIKTGMVMALDLHSTSTSLLIAAGYESGHSFLYHRTTPSWQKIYSSQPHSQPILSLFVSPYLDYFLTSSADAIIAKHPFPTDPPLHASDELNKPIKTIQTKHSGQQGLQIRSDGKVFATAGWDSRVRVYSSKTMRELAVLKWHRDGCFATAFAEILPNGTSPGEGTEEKSRPHDLLDDGTNTFSEKSPAQLPTSTDQPIINSKDYMDLTVQQHRDLKAKWTHWLAAGSKDGKVSLWDIY